MESQVFFVNSSQASKGRKQTKAEKSRILSLSQTRRRIAERRKEDGLAKPWEQQTSVITTLQDVPERIALSRSSPSYGRVRDGNLGMIRPNMNATDPFYCTVAGIDAGDHSFLRFTFSSATKPVFLAEAFAPPEIRLSKSRMRHDEVLEERLRRCVEDETLIYSTLAYGSRLLSWLRDDVQREKMQPYLLDQALQRLRTHLSKSTERADDWLILSIYSLAAAELWAGIRGLRGHAGAPADHDFGEHLVACQTHLQAALILVAHSGGWGSFDPYVLDSLLLIDKYLGITRGRPTMIEKHAEWDPGSLLPAHRRQIGMPDKHLLSLGEEILSLPLKRHTRLVIVELIDYCRCATVVWSGKDPDTYLESWLFRRIQAISSRLMRHRYDELGTLDHLIYSIAMVFILICMKDRGPSMGAASIATEMRGAFQKLCTAEESLATGVGLRRWIAITACLIGDFSESAWYGDQARHLIQGLTLLELETSLDRYLYLRSIQAKDLQSLFSKLQID